LYKLRCKSGMRHSERQLSLRMNPVLKKRYEILGVLGKGGMGRVYKVTDLRSRKLLAAKELRFPVRAGKERTDALIQFRTEAGILARLTHPHLPKVYDFFSFQNRCYTIMEFIDGKTLSQIFAKRKGEPLDEQLILEWAIQICRTMHFLSVQKPHPIVFRDLKPSNIMITKKGAVKLIDFGIARFYKEDRKKDTFVYGTPGYAAPEQYGCGQTDVRSDIFSLGATLFHCLSGQNPSGKKIALHDLRKLNPLISKKTAAMIQKAMELDRSKRFQTASEMKRAIVNCLPSANTSWIEKLVFFKNRRETAYISSDRNERWGWSFLRAVMVGGAIASVIFQP